MYYHKWPEYGRGSHEYVCPIDFDEDNKITLSADFSNTHYKWDDMKDSYANGENSVESCDAVSKLMYHIGVSLEMVYRSNGSSPTSIREAEALCKYFKYRTDIVCKSDVQDEELASILYDELKNKRPVFVCGKGADNGYHAFVCDGYKSGGYFHINWGWNGHYNAYFLVSAMTPLSGTDYSLDHRVVYRIEPNRSNSSNDSFTFHVKQPGTLQSTIDSFHANDATSLTIVGDINGSDILALRKMAGRDEYNNKVIGLLETLDLSQANIVDGGECYYKTDDETYYHNQNGTKANLFPEQAFMSTGLKKIVLPSSTPTIGRYSFVFCQDLTDVVWNDNIVKIDFSAFNYTSMKSVVLPESIVEIGPYAFCNMNNLKKVKLGKNIRTIGYRAFEKDDSISEIHSDVAVPFPIRTDVFSNHCYENATLYVPKNTAGYYKQCTGWKNFKKIVEKEELKGDANDDGQVTVTDVMFTVNHVLGKQDEAFCAANADMNGDGEISIADVMQIVNCIFNGSGTGGGIGDTSQAYLTCPDGHYPHMIDLGLPSGTKWACCNVEAEKPEDFGGRYAWGETETKDVYDWQN